MQFPDDPVFVRDDTAALITNLPWGWVSSDMFPKSSQVLQKVCEQLKVFDFKSQVVSVQALLNAMKSVCMPSTVFDFTEENLSFATSY